MGSGQLFSDECSKKIRSRDVINAKTYLFGRRAFEHFQEE